MCPYNVGWGNGRFNRLPSSYNSTIRQQIIPTAVQGELIYCKRPALRTRSTDHLLLPPVNYNDTSAFSFLLSSINQVTPLYKHIINISLPLPKLDWVATRSFVGGIEHWGLITSGSETASWNEKNGVVGKAGILAFAAHEIAHQWSVLPHRILYQQLINDRRH